METTTQDLILESPLLKLPLELLRTNLKAQQKSVEKEVAIALATLNTLDASSSAADFAKKIGDLLDRIKMLRRKVTLMKTTN